MVRALLLDAASLATIAAMRRHAAANPISREQLAAMSKGFDPLKPATRKGRQVSRSFTHDIPFGYRVTYTLEQQPPGLCRHISVSVGAVGRAPSPYAICELLGAFGFRVVEGVPLELGPSVLLQAGERGDVYVYTEQYEQGRMAVNVVEAVDPVSLAKSNRGKENHAS